MERKEWRNLRRRFAVRKAGIFAVAGRPVLHSESPGIQNAGFAASGIDAVYTRLTARSAREALEVARQIGMGGMNVTTPFKEEMAKLLDGKEARVRKLGAVNAVILKNGKARGFNTDVDGVSGALAANGVRMRGRKAVVLGAGGAAKAAVMALLESGAKVTVANRTVGKARAIAGKFGCGARPISGKGFAMAMDEADILVSGLGTTARVVGPKLLRRGMVVLDANYSRKTALSADATARGCRVIAGREWLLAQGTAAFRIFAGRKAPAKAMGKALAGRKDGGKGNIALIGFMGSGKTETAKCIAGLCRLQAIEIDDIVEKKAGMKISRIFREKGEAAFREMERKALLSGVKGKKRVISCGGGAVLDKRNVDALKRNCVVVWLWATPEECVKRTAGGSSRPLLEKKDRLASAKKLLDRRLFAYAAASDLVVSTEGRTPKEVARLVVDETGIAGKR